MDANKALAIIETILGRQLNEVQILVVRGVWEGESYQQIARERENYTEKYVKQIGYELWKSLSQDLSQELNLPGKVTKKNLKSVLLWYTHQQAATPESSKNPHPNVNNLPHCDWGERLGDPTDLTAEIEKFYGREEELQTLRTWCLTEQCRLICLLGMGGMGKTSLAWQFAHQVQTAFDRVIWRSLLNPPLVTDLITDLLQFLHPTTTDDLPTTFAGQVELLLTDLKQYRCLIVLDNLEVVLQAQAQAGQYRWGYDGYAQLLQAIGEFQHQSCLILTTSEKPQHLGMLETKHPKLVKTLNVGGLGVEEGQQLFHDCGAPRFEPEIWQRIYNHYGGNPLALKIAAITAVERIGGGENIHALLPLLSHPYYKFEGIEDLMARQFDRLSSEEKQIVYCLAIAREPITLTELRANRLPNIPDRELVNALQSLQRRCVTIRPDRSWSLQPVMMEYATSRLIRELIQALSPATRESNDAPQEMSQRLVLLNHHSLVLFPPQNHRHQTQRRTILSPLLKGLIAQWGSQGELENYLQEILRTWELLDPIPPGYLVANLHYLLGELRENI